LETASVLPAWARALAKQEALGTRYASPSTLAESEKGPAPSPLATLGGLGRYRRGDLIHKLLQVLPDLPPEQFESGAELILSRERDLTDAQRLEMTKAALAVLTDPQFAAVFGPGSRPEVAIAGRAEGLPENLAISGRVDRLVVSAERVLVVDFKTNRPAPATIDKADRAYLVQMAVYVAVLREVFPGRAIEAALVWTDGPKLMPIPNDLVAKTLEGLKSH
jgi:ATP-dependent helicase/nuclease subunit A